MRYAKIKENDVVNGTGIGVSLFVQGCPHHCDGCFNVETWDFNGGVYFTPKNMLDLINMLENKDFFSVLGGEPLCYANYETVNSICRLVKTVYPDIPIYIWTGYKLPDIEDRVKDIFNYIDFLIDGKFVKELKDITLSLRGSSNQNIYTFEGGKKCKK